MKPRALKSLRLQTYPSKAQNTIEYNGNHLKAEVQRSAYGRCIL